MTAPTITIIGAGNMGSSLIGGLVKDGHPADKIWATDTDAGKLNHLKQAFQVQTTIDNHQAVQSSDVVIFAIKPQLFAKVAQDLAKTIQLRKPLVISIAAGIRESSLQHWLGDKIGIVRAMPNTPALICCGATALHANEYVKHEDRNIAESILRAVGVVVWLDKEELMDAVTALSGSGPAYFFLMMEALQEAGEQLGLNHEIARLLTLQTGLGAARMAIESGKPLAELRHHVTSPGGTTEKALSVLEDNHIREIFRKALHSAKVRSEELANLMEKT